MNFHKFITGFVLSLSLSLSLPDFNYRSFRFLSMGISPRVYALKAEKGLEVGVVPRGVELFAFDACLAAGVAAQLVEHHAA